MPRRLVLASASPARLATLRAAGFDPEVVVSGLDESGVTGTPTHIALTLATAKARAVARDQRDALVLGCDSVLDLDGVHFGKPRDAADAISRWRLMRGRMGHLHTGHCLIDTMAGDEVAATASTAVEFADVSDDEIEAYVATGEPLLVAGAFTIDGFGGSFVERVSGDPHNVVGLSLPLLRRLLHHIGITVPSLWARAASSSRP